MDSGLQTFITQLPSDKIGQIVAFSTTGSMDSTLKQIRKEAERKEILFSIIGVIVVMLNLKFAQSLIGKFTKKYM